MFTSKKDAKRLAVCNLDKFLHSDRQLRSDHASTLLQLDDNEIPVAVRGANNPDDNLVQSQLYLPNDLANANFQADSAANDLFVLPQSPISQHSHSPESLEQVEIYAHVPIILADSDDEMAESLSLGPPVFDGSSSNDPQSWLSCLEDFIKYKGLDDEKRLALFKLRLSSNARSWLTTLPPNNQDTFAHLKDAFLERFQPKEMLQFRFAKELFNQKQQTGQDVDSFITDIRVKASLVGMDAKSQLWAALNGLLPHISAYVLEHSPESLEDVLRHARVVEMTRGSDMKKSDDIVSKQLDQLAQQMSLLTTQMMSMTAAEISHNRPSDEIGKHVSFREPRSRSPSPFRPYDGSAKAMHGRPNPESQRRGYDEQIGQRSSYQDVQRSPNYPQPRFASQQQQYMVPEPYQQQGPCSRCGRLGGHRNPLYCPALNYECHNGNNRGHSYRVCRANKRRNQRD